MTEVWNRPVEFSPFIEGTAVQFAWDSTSLGWLKSCPQLYKFHMIDGWFPKGDNPHLTFGLIFHSALETFDRVRTRGASHEEATYAMVRHALQRSGHYIDGVWKPWHSDHTVKNRETLVRSLVWYTETYKVDPAPAVILDDGTPAVEHSFRFAIDMAAPNGEDYMLSGHFDKVVNYADSLFISDKKTSGHQLGDHFFSTFDLDNQMSLYTLAGKIVLGLPIKGVLIDGAQVAVGFTAFLRGLTYRTAEKLDEWLADVKVWLRHNEDYASRGHWPKNDKSCNNYMDSKGMGGCPFKKVCSRQPSQRESVLQTDFVKKRWNPLVPRTEDDSRV